MDADMSRLRSLVVVFTLAAGLLAPTMAAFAAVPPPVPALPDVQRQISFNITASTCACSLGSALNLYGDSTDFNNWVEVWLNGVNVAFNDPVFGWTITSPTGPLASIPRPITDGVLTFNTAQTGTVIIVGARRPRRTLQFQENVGVPTRNFNVVLSDIIAMLREVWDKINDVTGRAVLARPGETLALLPVQSARANMGACFDGSGNLTSCVAIASFTFASGINTVTTNYTAIGSDCNLTIVATGGLNTLTLPGAATLPIGCEITFKNGETYAGIGTAHGKKLVNFPSDWNNILWPLQAGKVKSNGVAWLTVVNPGRWKLPTSAEICVSQNGDDTNDGLAAGTGCMQTTQAAVVAIGTQWDGGGYNSCSLGFYAGGTNILAGNTNQTGQSIGCFITINIRGAITWASTGACWTGGDNSITIVNWNLGFTPTFKCNSANTASTGQLKCHQYCVFDINGGTAIWLPSGNNDVFFDLDLQGSATYNATVNVGDAVNTYTPLAFIACEAHCSKVTVSGSLAFSPLVTMGVVYVLRAGSVITTGITFPGVTATNPSTPTGNSVLITNGTTIPGGTSSGSGGQVCTTAC
jgi:hypothetical protein